jgi:hypothetical protein
MAMKRVLVLGVMLALAGCPKPQTQSADGGGGVASKPPAAAVAWTGNATDFTFSNFAGGQTKLSSLGKPVLLNFWADW